MFDLQREHCLEARKKYSSSSLENVAKGFIGTPACARSAMILKFLLETTLVVFLVTAQMANATDQAEVILFLFVTYCCSKSHRFLAWPFKSKAFLERVILTAPFFSFPTDAKLFDG